MSFVKIPKSVSESPTIPSGIYGKDETAKIVSSKIREVPKNDEGETFWDIGVLVSTPKGGVFVHTSPFGGANTKLVPGSGSRAFVFAAQLGIADPEEGFDPEMIVGQEVVVEVAYREWTDEAGEKHSRNSVKNIWLRS